MLESAPKEEELKSKSSDDDITEDSIENAADAGLNLMCEQCDDPVVHKLALIKICHNMVLWHTRVGQNAQERGDEDCGIAWTRDAGKWQAIMDIAMSIGLGPNDSWCNHD